MTNEQIFEKVNAAQSDEEVKKYMKSYIESKFKNKNDSRIVKLEEANWIAYSGFRNQGRGRIISFILAEAFAFNVAVNNLIGSNNIDYIKDELSYACKHPFKFWFKTAFKRSILAILPGTNVGMSIYTMYESIFDWIRMYKNSKRNNTDTAVFETALFNQFNTYGKLSGKRIDRILRLAEASIFDQAESKDEDDLLSPIEHDSIFDKPNKKTIFDEPDKETIFDQKEKKDSFWP